MQVQIGNDTTPLKNFQIVGQRIYILSVTSPGGIWKWLDHIPIFTDQIKLI
jgi:hypothetical protein